MSACAADIDTGVFLFSLVIHSFVVSCSHWAIVFHSGMKYYCSGMAWDETNFTKS